MSKQPFQDDSSVAAKLFAALGSATADALRELFSTTRQLEWSDLTAQLDRDGESYFYWAKSYCERWAREGEPRPTSSVPRPHHTMSEGFDPWADLPQDSTPEPLALWDSEQAQMCRGALRGSLRKLIPPRDEATSETPGLNEAKRSVAPGDATFKALPVSEHTPDTTATEGAPVDRERGSATKVDPSDVLTMFMNMELLWMETCEHSADGLEGYDRLFGEEDLYSALTVLGDRRADFSKRLPGVVHTIADFAVTSGHEAAAFFASRVANYAKVGRRSIPEHRSALAAARETKDEAQIVALKHKLDQASRHFAESMQKAFNGWFEHRAWMRRSIEQEIALGPAPARNGGQTVSSDPTAIRTSPSGASGSSAPSTLDAYDTFHEAIEGVAGNLSNTLLLIEQYPQHSFGVAVMQHHLQQPQGEDPEPGTPERAAKWRVTLGLLRKDYVAAKDLWDNDLSGKNSRLHLAFDRVSEGKVTCGVLHDLTYHGLLLQVARIVLDPRAPGAVPQNALAAVAKFAPNDNRLHESVQGQVIRALQSRPWWESLALGMKREHALVLAAASSNPHPAVAASDVRLVGELTGNLLIRERKTWRIRFAGKEALLSDLVGFVYLQKLLASPHKPIGVAELRGGAAVLLATKQPSTDPSIVSGIKSALQDAAEDLREAVANNDEAKRDSATKTIHDLETSLPALRSRSASRQLPSELEQVRSAVGQAIRAALSELRAVHPEAHGHIKQGLVTPTGLAPCYRPGVATSWVVNLTADAAEGQEAN